MKTLFLIVFLILSGFFFVALSASPVLADGPYTLRLGSWVCKSAQDYDTALARQKQGESPFKLAKELFDSGSCIYMDDDNLEDMLAPYITVVDTQGDKSQVTFFVEFYRRVAMLHRKIRHVKFVGWTESDNIIKHRQAD